MTITIKPAPVRKSVLVKAPQARAFEVFASQFARWWPSTHSINRSPIKNVVLEPRVGGRWYEVGEDGSECNWGKVLIWEPPSRLVLAWQINASWKFDPDLVTEIEVRLTPEGPDATRVDLEHRYLERMGESAESARASFDSPNGWGFVLERFAQVAAAAE